VANPTTLQNVADRAGVHRTTVSLALRDHPRIPAGTRRRIQAIARRLGYRVNPLVAALMRSRRTGTRTKHVVLAYVTNYPTRFGWRPQEHDRPDFFPGAVERARDFGFTLQHFWLGEPGMTPGRFCEVLAVRNVHGLLLGRLPPGQSALNLQWEKFSCVALGMTLRSPVLHHVTENHFETVWHAMRRCVDRGYRRVGFVVSAPDDSPDVGSRWLSAYLGQQERLGLVDRPPICRVEEGDGAAFHRWFTRWSPDALIVSAAGPVLGWLRDLGQSVPGDIALVELGIYHPELDCAGLYYEAAKVGALAVEMLVGMLHRGETGVPRTPHEVLLTGAWQDGRTLPPVGPFAVQSTMSARRPLRSPATPRMVQ
jgi:DNA-binding LacI/PurR family transcriptional regulator